MATQQHGDKGNRSDHRPSRNPAVSKDARTESRTRRPDDLRAAGQGRDEGSDDHRSGSESGKV